MKEMYNKRLGLKENKKGYSLIEVLVTVLIFSVLAAAVQTTLMVGQSSWQTNSVRVELVQEIRKAMSQMKDELRQTAPSAITDGPTSADGQPSTSITFYLPAGVSGNVITWSSDTTQYVLGGADSNELQRIEGTETRVVAHNISLLELTRQVATPDIIEVTLQAQKNTAAGLPITLDFSFEVQMRN